MLRFRLIGIVSITDKWLAQQEYIVDYLHVKLNYIMPLILYYYHYNCKYHLKESFKWQVKPHYAQESSHWSKQTFLN
jgi:hypothetical protein